MPNTSIAIVNWNGQPFLARCLASVQAQTCPDYEIILVDNGSSDGSPDWVAEHFPQVRLIRNAANRGFAAANNQAIRAATGDYIATLNNDTQVSPGWLAALVEAAEGEARVGMCASQMVFADRPTVINSTGICVDRAGIAWDRRGGEPDDGQGAQVVEVFGPCAGAALYRRAMLDEIGLFDEDFFAYLEDVDLAWRARRAGWRCLYVPAARVLHHHSATGVEGSPFKSFQLGRNKVWLLIKNYPFRQLGAYALLAVVYDIAAVIYALAARRDVHALRGRLAGLAGAGRMWRKRDEPRSPSRPDIAHLSPLEWPWRVTARYGHITPA